MSQAITRDKKGQWLKGASGNPLGARIHRSKLGLEYLQVMADECTLEDWRLITRRAITDAIDGKPSARTWLSNYILGPAHALVDRESSDHAVGDGTVERKLVRLMAVIEETIITE